MWLVHFSLSYVRKGRMQKGTFILCRIDSENTDFPLRGMLLEDLGKIQIASYPVRMGWLKQLLIVGIYYIFPTCTYETFSKEKLKLKDCPSVILIFFPFFYKDELLWGSPFWNLPPRHCHRMLLEKQLLTLVSTTSQPIFVSPQSPFLKQNLLQGGQVGRVRESTMRVHVC